MKTCASIIEVKTTPLQGEVLTRYRRNAQVCNSLENCRKLILTVKQKEIAIAVTVGNSLALALKAEKDESYSLVMVSKHGKQVTKCKTFQEAYQKLNDKLKEETGQGVI